MLRTLDPDVAVSHLDRLYVAAKGLCRDPWLAEDLVHDVYAKTLARPRRLHGDDELAYLMRSLYNRWKDHLRSSSRATLEPIDELPDLPGSAVAPELAAEHNEVLAAVHRLHSPYRETVVAVDVVGLTYSQAARALGVPIGTIMGRLFRARGKIAADLRGDPPSTAEVGRSSGARRGSG